MLPFSQTAVAPLTKGQVPYKRRSHCKVSCSKPYAWFFSGAIGTDSIQVLLWVGGCSGGCWTYSRNHFHSVCFLSISYVRYYVENWAYKHNVTAYPLSLRKFTILWKSLNSTQIFNSRNFSLCSNCTKVLNTFFVFFFSVSSIGSASMGAPVPVVHLDLPISSTGLCTVSWSCFLSHSGTLEQAERFISSTQCVRNTNTHTIGSSFVNLRWFILLFAQERSYFQDLTLVFSWRRCWRNVLKTQEQKDRYFL